MLFAFLGVMLEKRGLTAMRIRPTLLRAESREQRAESREQRAESREQANCALFASCDRRAFETEYYICDV